MPVSFFKAYSLGFPSLIPTDWALKELNSVQKASYVFFPPLPYTDLSLGKVEMKRGVSQVIVEGSK
jgi:hypothetical protein